MCLISHVFYLYIPHSLCISPNFSCFISSLPGWSFFSCLDLHSWSKDPSSMRSRFAERHPHKRYAHWGTPFSGWYIWERLAVRRECKFRECANNLNTRYYALVPGEICCWTYWTMRGECAEAHEKKKATAKCRQQRGCTRNISVEHNYIPALLMWWMFISAKQESFRSKRWSSMTFVQSLHILHCI